MIKNTVIVLAFNARLTDGCDYATQTMRLLGTKNRVFALALGDPVSWKQIWREKIIEHRFNGTVIHPFFIIPGQRYTIIKTINYFLNSIALRVILLLKYPHKQKLLWFFEPHNMKNILQIFYGYRSVYDCVDYFKNQDYLLTHVHVMTCISKTLANAYKKKRATIHVVPLGFSPELFPRKVIQKKTNNVVGFIGGINYRLDYPLLFKIIKKLQNKRFVFIGPIQLRLIPNEGKLKENIRKLFLFPNVEYIGEVDKPTIGQYIKTFSIGIIPYDTSYLFNRYSYPMKIMEYLWFGLPVVTTDMAAITGLPGVSVARTAKEWITRIKQTKITNQQAQRKVVMANTWEQKIEAICDILQAQKHKVLYE